MVKYYTSTDLGHRHTYDKKNKNTSFDNRHSHPLDLKKGIAKKGSTNHTHRLLKNKA